MNVESKPNKALVIVDLMEQYGEHIQQITSVDDHIEVVPKLQESADKIPGIFDGVDIYVITLPLAKEELKKFLKKNVPGQYSVYSVGLIDFPYTQYTLKVVAFSDEHIHLIPEEFKGYAVDVEISSEISTEHEA